MSGHTPGPWACDANEYDSFCPVLSKLGQVICDTAFLGGSQRVANSMLIAAAPDLLEALCTLMDECEIVSDDASAAWHKARAAIAKATGDET